MGTLEDWGWNGYWEGRFSDFASDSRQPARVTADHRDRWILQFANGSVDARIPGAVRDGRLPTTGDWVVAEAGPFPADPWSIVAVLPRRSALSRGAAGDGSQEQVLAANVDRLWIVEGLDTPPNLRRLERYIAVGWESGASPEVVLTKSDLAEDVDTCLNAVRGIAIGATVWAVSVSNAEAIVALQESLEHGSTVALVGPSGAGKSTLINILAGAQVARTGEVREGDRKGRHTTTSRELIRVHNGALLLDTPGLRELRVHHLDEGLGSTFPRLERLAQQCRFRDCMHRSEPGCAVLEAVAIGELPTERLESYRKLRAEAEYQRRKADPRAMAEQVAEHKTAMKTLKQVHPKYRRGK